MSMGHTYKSFGFYISYTILTLPVYFPPVVYATYSLYLPPSIPLPPTFQPLSLCPWVVHVSSLAYRLPILFLTSPVYFQRNDFATYSLYLFQHSPLPFPDDNPPCDLHFCVSVPVLVVFLVSFCFCLFLVLVVDSCEFVVILLFIFLSSFS